MAPVGDVESLARLLDVGAESAEIEKEEVERQRRAVGGLEKREGAGGAVGGLLLPREIRVELQRRKPFRALGPDPRGRGALFCPRAMAIKPGT